MASIRGTRAPFARAPPAITTAAAPSPKSPVATRFVTDESSRWRVSEQSSTDNITETSPGNARSASDARAIPAAPAMQPSPKSGVRLTEGLRPSRFASFASSDGVEIPVTVTNQS